MKSIFREITFFDKALAFTFLWLTYGLADSPSRILQFDRFNIQDGLSQGAVQSIIQDDYGFIWIGTQDGLNRFDGYQFEVFRQSPLDSFSLSGKYIQTMLKGHTGNLWIGTFNGGLDRLDPATERFIHFKNDPNDSQSLSSNIVLSLMEDRSGILWVGTYGGGLNKLEPGTGVFTHYKNDPDNPMSISNDIVLDIFEDSEGIMWIGTMGGGLDKFDRESGNFTHFRNEPGNPQSLSHDRVWEIQEGEPGVLWIGTMNGGLNKFYKKTGKCIRYTHDPGNPQSLSNNVVPTIYKDRSGVLWIGTNAGIDLFDPKLEIFEQAKSATHQQDDLNDYIIQNIFEDNGGIIWISTFGGGIFKYDPHRIKFRHYHSQKSDPNGLTQNNVFAIQGDPGNDEMLWIGTFGGGLNRWNRKTGKYTHYLYQQDNSHSLSADHIQAIYFDHTRTMWVGTTGNGLNRYDRVSDSFIRYQHDPDNPKTLSSNRVQSIYEDRENVLWVGTYGGGLNRFDREAGEFTYFKQQPDDFTSLSNDIIKVIFEDSKERFWIGTLEGLNLFDRSTGKSIRFVNNPQNPNSISNNEIQCIYEDKEGILWISTFGGGLNRFDPETNVFRVYKEEDGLPHNSLYDILPDDRGNLWISTSRGLTKFNPQTEVFRNYDSRDGLQGEDFNSGACYSSRSGEMFFGGTNGFNSFYPDSIHDNPHVPPIVITNFQKFNKDVSLSNPVYQANMLNLSYKDYVFSLEFAALDFAYPEKNQYAYKMEGFEEEWNYSKNRRFVTYTNLDPGHYTFRVKGSNNDGIWNEEGAALSIYISPPFWKTWWFTTMSSGLILSFILLVITRIKSRERKMAEIDLKISDLKMQALASQMKPHFVFNIINSIQYLVSNNEQRTALDNMSKFAKLLRLSLDNSLKTTISVTEELNFLSLYLELEQFRFENKFNYQIDIDPGIDSDNTEIPVMCIQPFVENAVIHGLSHNEQGGELKVSFFNRVNELICEVKDNGPGINKSLQSKKNRQNNHHSLGMKVTEERLRLLSGRLDNEDIIKKRDLGENDGEETGTLIKIRLPVSFK